MILTDTTGLADQHDQTQTARAEVVIRQDGGGGNRTDTHHKLVVQVLGHSDLVAEPCLVLSAKSLCLSGRRFEAGIR
jgi:hypothetical protein